MTITSTGDNSPSQQPINGSRSFQQRYRVYCYDEGTYPNIFRASRQDGREAVFCTRVNISAADILLLFTSCLAKSLQSFCMLESVKEEKFAEVFFH